MDAHASTNIILLADEALRQVGRPAPAAGQGGGNGGRCNELANEVRARTALCLVSLGLAIAMATAWAISTACG